MASPSVRVSGQDRKQQILEVATELFARQGFEGTTTREIARCAEVNEAILFRHFPSKEELYWAVIEHNIERRKRAGRIRESLESGAGDYETLRSITEQMLNRDTTMSRLLLFSALENHELAARLFHTHVSSFYEEIADYIRKGIAEGRFREVDPMLAARAFLGMAVYHFLIQEIFGVKRFQKYDNAEVSRTLTDIWLRGMQAPNGKAAKSSAASKVHGSSIKITGSESKRK